MLSCYKSEIPLLEMNNSSVMIEVFALHPSFRGYIFAIGNIVIFLLIGGSEKTNNNDFLFEKKYSLHALHSLQYI